MSLDVSLMAEVIIRRKDSGIFIREYGCLKEIPRDQWDEMCPGHEPTIAEQVIERRSIYSANITHNLGRMAEEAGIYQHLWRPEEIGITTAGELIEPLERGLTLLKERPEHFEQFNSPNGWGLYENFVPFVEAYLEACLENPDAVISVSR